MDTDGDLRLLILVSYIVTGIYYTATVQILTS